MNNQRLTVTDYVVSADGKVLDTKPSLREARLFIRDLGRRNTIPQLVELIKRTTTQTVMNIYPNK